MILSDTSGISIWTKPILVIVIIVVLMAIMLGIIKLYPFRKPTHNKKKTNTKLISIRDWAIGIIVCALLMIVVMLALGNFEIQYKGLEGEYCIQSGGTWNFYECYNVGTGLGNNGGDSACNYPPEKYKTGYWCDYPDGTSKSANQIGYMINSTV